MAKAKAWHDDDRFWKRFASTMFSERLWKWTPEQVDHVIALASPEPGCPVLDMCCGPGRHSLEFARRDFRVTGVDRTRSYLAEARRRAREEKLKIEFVLADAREFRRPNSFDLAVNLFTSFGYFRDPADQDRMLKGIFEALRPGGKLVMDMLGKEILARRFCEREWDEIDGRIILEERHILNNWTEIENHWILLDGNERFDGYFRHWIYSAAELTDLLQKAGFSAVEVRGNLAGDPYDHTATRLVAIASKTT